MYIARLCGYPAKVMGENGRIYSIPGTTGGAKSVCDEERQARNDREVSQRIRTNAD